MSKNRNRRNFMEQISSGMLVAGVGATTAMQIGVDCTFANHESKSQNDLSFGKLDSLVDLMQTQQPEQLQQTLVKKLNRGETTLKKLVAAASLANAETFGGQDYVGYHTEMALVPALEMSAELSGKEKPLPVLKVIYRNAQQIQNVGGAKKKTLHHQTAAASSIQGKGQAIRDISRKGDMARAEQLFASVDKVPLNEKFNAILPAIEDDINVHRFVLAHRAYELIDIVGEENAQTMLRQCIRYCVDTERNRIQKGRQPSPIRKHLPKLVSQFKLHDRKLGSRDPGEEWIEEMGNLIYDTDKFEASESVAAALADGISPKAVSEAISVAANLLVLKQGADRWRTHGDSAGVHASDAANAWRNILDVANQKNAVGGLICSAFHTARYDSFKGDPYPTEAHRLKVKVASAKELLGLAEECIRANDQAVAAAAIQVYGDKGFTLRPVFDLMLKYAISEDGRLHAEKYYRTVCEEFNSMRPRFKLRQLVALARVTASSFGYDRFDNKGHRAPGYQDARKLLKV